MGLAAALVVGLAGCGEAGPAEQDGADSASVDTVTIELNPEEQERFASWERLGNDTLGLTARFPAFAEASFREDTHPTLGHLRFMQATKGAYRLSIMRLSPSRELGERLASDANSQQLFLVGLSQQAFQDGDLWIEPTGTQQLASEEGRFFTITKEGQSLGAVCMAPFGPDKLIGFYATPDQGYSEALAKAFFASFQAL